MKAPYNLASAAITEELNIALVCACKVTGSILTLALICLHMCMWVYTQTHKNRTFFNNRLPQSCMCGRLISFFHHTVYSVVIFLLIDLPVCFSDKPLALVGRLAFPAEEELLLTLSCYLHCWWTGAVASSLVKQKLQEVILKKQKQAALERTNSNTMTTPPVAYRWNYSSYTSKSKKGK